MATSETSAPAPSATLLRELVEAAPDAFVVVDETGTIALVNAQTERLFGYPRSQLLNQKVEMLIPDRLRVKHSAHREGFSQNPRTREMGAGMQLVGRRRDGSEFPVEISLSPIRTQEGILVSSAIRDVSGRTAAQNRLKESEERFSKFFESAPFGAVIVRTTDGTILSVNDALLELVGRNRDEMQGQSMAVLNLVNPEVRASLVSLAGPEGEISGAEAPVRTKTGETRDCLVSTRLLTIAGEECGLTVLMDISQRKNAERALEATTEELRAANRELDAFAYSVSHDLRAPLRAIDGFSKILLESFSEQLPEEAKRDVRMIVESAQEMGQLIDDLLAFSRFSRQTLSRRDVDVEQLVRPLLDTLQAENPNRSVRVRIQPLPPCEADPNLLRQVFANLLGNAFKYTRKKALAEIEIGHTPTGAYYVKDNGVGFDMKFADKLFGVFQRLHRAEEYEGTGVGLAIVNRIVARHGGRVWAESAPDQGATFCFTLDGARQP